MTRMKKVRLDQGITLDEVAKAVGYKNRVSIHLIETKKQGIRFTMIPKIEKFYGMGYKELLEEIEE